MSFTIYGALWTVATAGFPFFIALSFVFDLAKSLTTAHSKRLPLTRAYLFFLLYLNCEIIGLLISFACWILSGRCIGIGHGTFIRMNAWLQGWWAYALLYGALTIFSMKLEVENSDAILPGPIILLIRHSSTADTVLAAVLVAKNKKLLLRYILKKELLWDPCLDVVGNRLPNVFVERSGNNTSKELSKIKALTRHMQASDGLLIYPEGTRFHPEKLIKAVQTLKINNDIELAEKAARMHFVLPPKKGGILTVMESTPGVDAVFCTHAGFEGAADFKKFCNGALIGKTVHVKFWRIKASQIPGENEKKLPWLYDQWLEMDSWISESINN